MFEKFKKNRETNKIVIDMLNDEIADKASSVDSNAKEVFDLWEKRQTVKMRGLPIGDVMKIASNVLIVSVIIAFEARYVLNKTATKFIRPL